MFALKKLDRSAEEKIQQIIDLKTKPPGALGQLESLAKQLALITGNDRIKLVQPTMLVFAGDHGIAQEGISIAPSEVTQQMVLNFLAGGAAINCFCRVNQMAMQVIDAGILVPVEHPDLRVQSLGQGTCNFAETKAMDIKAVEEGLHLGASIVYEKVAAGSNVFGFGEMGIGNTSAAAAILSAFNQLPAVDTVGRGTGINDQVLAKKIQLIDNALELHKADLSGPKEILAAVGGFEIVQMTGAMLAAAEKQCVLLVDGFIATAAALTACKIDPAARDYMVFCHRSKEKAHRLMLDALDAKPLLDLDLRLGEGTGAALAMPLLRAAESFYNEMASFESAGVTEV